MEEYDESSDVEMIPIEEVDRVKTISATELRIQTPPLDDSYYENSTNTFTTGIDIFSKEEKLKMEERAKRFGLLEKFKESPNREENLYSSMGITDDSDNSKNIRLNVIHMRGTEEMSTKDVFKYFQDYAPMSIEWINDVSCNIVWFDNLSAARAMLALSKTIIGSVAKYSDREEDPKNSIITADEENESIVDTDGKEENCINIKDINYPLPPGIWRKGMDYPKSKGIFLRFATRMDKKPANAEKRSKYYKKYGNPNFGGLKGILTESRKRMYKQIQNKHTVSNEDKDRNQTKNPWGALSETWGMNDVVEDDFLPRNGVKDHQVRGIKERLGVKYRDKDVSRTEDLEETSSSSDSDENWCKRSKIPRMRMHADDEEEKLQKRKAKLRYQMVLNSLNSSGDLRSKLGRPRTKAPYRDPIQVVVTNTNLTKSKHDNSEITRQDYQNEAQLSEKEEGEWQESEDEDNQVEKGKLEQKYGQCILVEEEEEREREEEEREREEEEEDEDEEGEHKEDEEDDDDDDSDEVSNVPAKEIQGPKGSVIKVVPPKPRIASTVWARLNHTKSETSDSYLKNRRSMSSHDLRSTLKGGDLRSRIGNHTRGRSPLRIEVKNDKYTKDNNEGE
ncbi:nuclear cap-binding protein subunit 3-like [Nylanderia fulva]|uniref:nuclear cap-binding protein subunit 3-like n=1 Tax=Nylanderia fulva TaxID=613905 RepID=UPI0010FADB9B|nr:nuclear cap-binding protein subunit 3-like [Nylanderia fulva]XP_029159704.1 nuclear cap-binding protein subunit 3-like [Nylanderia fulva]